MKLRAFLTDTILEDIRGQLTPLNESISDYLAVVLAKLKADKIDLFDGETPEVNPELLAGVIAGLKVLSTRSYRAAMTKDDIGINPNSAKEFYELVKTVTKDGKSIPKATLDVFKNLKSLAPSVYEKEMKKIKGFKDSEPSARKTFIQELDLFATKENQFFNRLKTAAGANEKDSAANDEVNPKLASVNNK